MQSGPIPGLDIKVAYLNPACKWRADTFFSKEPATVGWLGELGPNDVLWDVGANIGLYSLFAASRGAQVIAIEPMIPNLYALQCNLELNPNLAKRITIVPAALSNCDRFALLHLSSPDVASSCHSAGEPLNFKLQHKDHWQGHQGTILMRGDTLGQEIALPTAIKIDVDGFEHLVVNGFGPMPDCIRSFCIECNWNLAEHHAMVDQLQSMGFAYDPAQYAAAQRTEGTFVGVGEMILRRTP
jgi:FkbM family methyltransferase